MNAEQRIETICQEYGFVNEDGTPDVEALKDSEAFQEAFSEERTTRGALKSLSIRHEERSIRGFFLGEREWTEWDDEIEEMVVDATGVKILTTEGEVMAFANEQDPGQFQPLEPVETNPVTYRKNIIRGETRIGTDHADITLSKSEHEDPVPSVTLTEDLERANAVDEQDERRLTNGQWPPEGMNGPRWPTYALLTIGDFNEVEWWPSDQSDYTDEDVLRVTARDADNNAVSTKLPPEEVFEAYPELDETSPPDAFKETLEHEPIFVGGYVSVLYPRSIDQFAHPQDVEVWLQKAQKSGYLTKNYQTQDGTWMRKLDLSDAPEGHKAIEVDGERVFDVEETGDGWDFAVHHQDIGKHPYFVCKESHWTTDDGDIRTFNEGAFVTFLNQQGTVSSTDPWAEAAEML